MFVERLRTLWGERGGGSGTSALGVLQIVLCNTESGPRVAEELGAYSTHTRGIAHGGFAVPCSTQERRAARRELKNLAKTEVVSEEEQAKRLAELELREHEELLHSQLRDTSQVAITLPACFWCRTAVHTIELVHSAVIAHIDELGQANGRGAEYCTSSSKIDARQCP